MINELCIASMIVVALILVCLHFRIYLLVKQIERYETYLDSLSRKFSTYEKRQKELSSSIQDLTNLMEATSNDMK